MRFVSETISRAIFTGTPTVTPYTTPATPDAFGLAKDAEDIVIDSNKATMMANLVFNYNLTYDNSLTAILSPI
ncbi:MAG: hypothetical protein K2X29_03045, partial [Candidatus Obscuribacterales bacterium]|nr:hypothetical protein [Candidatus Obscuribacterales bacterium]